MNDDNAPPPRSGPGTLFNPNRGIVVHRNSHRYEVHVAGGNVSGATFGDHIENICQQRKTPEEQALAQGYREIPLCDIEVLPIDGGHGQPECYATRRRESHLARVEHRQVTVSIHRGKQAKEDFQREVADAMRFPCHPQLLQLFAVARAHNVHAVVYHGKLVHLIELLNSSSVSPLFRADVLVKWTLQYWDCELATGLSGVYLDPWFDLSNQRFRFRLMNGCRLKPPGHFPSLDSPPDPGVLQIGLWTWYRILWSNWYIGQVLPFTRSWISRIWTQDTWGMLGGDRVPIVHWTQNGVSPVASVQWRRSCDPFWHVLRNPDGTFWTTKTGHMRMWVTAGMTSIILFNIDFCDSRPWACQAEYFLRRIRTRNRLEYATINRLEVTVRVLPTIGMSAAFLVLEPAAAVFRADTVIPEIAYWSSTGCAGDRLSREEVYALRLPRIQVKAIVKGESLSEHFYAMMRAVHEAMGLDCYTSEIAESLGIPVFEFVKPAKPRIAKFYFFDEDWVEEDTSLHDLFPPDLTENKEEALGEEEEAENIHWIALLQFLLVMAGLITLVF